MKYKKITAAFISVLLILLTLTACNTDNTKSDTKAKTSSIVKGNIYRFENYKSSDIFDIEKISLNNNLSPKCKTYKFTYLSDNYKIKAYISIPKSCIESQKPAKCILYNRGGNRDYGKLEDDTTANICAVSNRVIIASQYRGADGSQGADEFGGGDLNDVIKLIDICQKKLSFVDMDDFCVAGASRGGMMTYMAARRDKRIKRIIAVSAVSDLFDSYKSRKDMQDVLLETIGCTPKEKPSEYKKRSAIYWYDEIKIPVLIFHSKLDKQVSFKQAEALYKKLKGSTDCTFIKYNDNIHGFHPQDPNTIKNWLEKK